MLKELFGPSKIGPVEIKNRIVMAPMVTHLANENGAVTKGMIDYYTERARGGVGLIIVESAYVMEEDREMGRIGIENSQLHVGLSELAELIQEHGTKAFLQLNHRGCVLSIKKGKGPDELSREEIEIIIEAFSTAALRAQKAGFDGVEIHGANVYLLTQFLSPLTNHRKDSYGQNLEGRMKFPIEVLLRVRKTVGKDYPIIFRMVGHQYTDGGLTLKDTKVFAERLEEAGASSLHVIAGSPVVPFWHCPPMAIPRGCHAVLAAEMKSVVRIPVMAVGRINDPCLANQILAEGKADFIVMGRPLIADPFLPLKAKEGKLSDIRKCLACNHCLKRSMSGRTIRCAINPEAGRERDSRIYPSLKPKRVMVVGGGAAGMEAARVLALRGHRVTLYEREEKLGGQINLAVLPPHKEEMQNILDYLTLQIQKLKVEVRMLSEVTQGTIEEENPDVIILAVGASPCIPEIPGLDREKIFTPAEVLKGNRRMGQKILVIGGGMVGCEVAEFLADKKKQVTIVEKISEIASEIEPFTKGLLLGRLKKLSVEVITEAEVVSVQGSHAILRKKGEVISIETDGIVAALGAQKNNLLERFQLVPGLTFSSIGDCRKVGDIGTALHEAFRVALTI